MKKLLSLPPNLVSSFHRLTGLDKGEWFCSSDPVGKKLGSGGGTTWLLREWEKSCGGSSEKKILFHAGGQSRRLPSYAPSGKVLTPIPVFRWARGQQISQNLLSLQLPLYEKILANAPASVRTLIASGDVYIRAEQELMPIPEADVVCYGLWIDPVVATHHGVFVMSKENPTALDYMLQKPSIQTLDALSETHLFLMDIGVWLFSDKALEVLKNKSLQENVCPTAEDPSADIRYYDMYADFGCALGKSPKIADKEVNELSVAILPLSGGEFYHYGTSRELLSSTLALQNKIVDQRKIVSMKLRPNASIFTQNSDICYPFTESNEDVWIENSHISASWRLGKRQIITGVPNNEWAVQLPDGVCVDVVPYGEKDYILRPYGFDDAFRGAITDEHTLYLGKSFREWMQERGITLNDILGNQQDLQSVRLFPILTDLEEFGKVLRWMVSEPTLSEGRELWLKQPKLSADEISEQANLDRLFNQRRCFLSENVDTLSRNYQKSVFYQLDLLHVAQLFDDFSLVKPEILPKNASMMHRIHNSMLRAQIDKVRGNDYSADESRAFSLLREGLLSDLSDHKQCPHLSVYSDQIVWGRSPVRIDVAGGWTDTPPFSLYAGGKVVNFAINLNGQQPLQVYIKPCAEYNVVLRSIDMGAMEVVSTYEELHAFNKVGSPFSIPKAALVLAGFSKEFSEVSYPTLEKHLRAFGSGLEITLLSAIPAGSGLGTSSILAATVLGSLSDFCGLSWDRNEICKRTLALEQLLTTGGGWQDQYGGVLQGVKLLQTGLGFIQQPLVSWLPTNLFTSPEYAACHLLYYTGITRTAKGILAEIVRSMFLNSSAHLGLLGEMKSHALKMAEVIQRCDFEAYGRLVGKTWQQNQSLDSGTNPPAVQALIDKIKDYTLGYKLPGAGGGGYLYMVAKDAQAALRIRKILSEESPNPRARFVDMSLSDTGFQLSRS